MFFILEGIGCVASIPLLVVAVGVTVVNGSLLFLLGWIAYVVLLFLVAVFAPPLH